MQAREKNEYLGWGREPGPVERQSPGPKGMDERMD